MIFRKTILVPLGVLLISLLNACVKSASEDETRIGFSQAMTNDDWRRSMNEVMQLKASLISDVDLVIKDANYKVAQQITQIEQLIADSVDVLIVSPIQSKPVTPVVQKALDAGIPVLVVDRKTENETYTAYLGADNVDVGRNAAKVIVSNAQNALRVVEIKGMAGSSPAEERSLGFNRTLAEFDNIEVVAGIEGDWEKESIENAFRTLLENDADIDYVFAHNDRMARGAWEVARDMGLENTMEFIGVDGLEGEDGGIQMVEDGVLKATILYPSGGDEAIELALKLLNGAPVPKNNILTTTVIDRFNADIMKNQFDKIKEQRNEIETQLSAIGEQEERYYAQNNLLKTTMALLAIILSLAIYSIYSIFAIRKKNRQLEVTNKKVTVQRNQIAKIAEEVKVVNEAKLNFFTGLSHEFKTPLTLILSAIESLGTIASERGGKFENEVALIHNNSNRLLRLINQLLDFRKVEDRKFTLKATKTDLVAFSQSIYNDFQREAKKRNIDFKLHCEHEYLPVFIDRNLMDKVYFNLLSNAFKFTPDNGKIEISIVADTPENSVAIHFKDSGIGIPDKELKHVFQAFFQGSNNRKKSSGLGLHLSKEFVDLHKGEIMVKSLHGTEFIVRLKTGSDHFEENELAVEQDWVDTNIIDFHSEYSLDDTYLMETVNSDSESGKPSILIIEDNRDLSLFLKNKLMSEYEIHLSDGTDAIEKAFEGIPDIIICDINLPEKSGFEICTSLKNDLRTSHIPTVILTASGNTESYLKGLESGADLYLTKPFSYSILIQSIKALLYNREKLRYYYTNNIHKIESANGFGNLEQEFIHNLNVLIKNNLDNADFSVENLAEELHISRVQLYRKVKAMMGVSISDYIGNIRLENARAMLESTTLTVSEIAYANGFSSPNYFSTAFKNQYGSSPVAHRKSM
ncbi:MAG: substrate-binding domain-containing protein [Pricia sp.]